MQEHNIFESCNYSQAFTNDKTTKNEIAVIQNMQSKPVFMNLMKDGA